MKKLKWSSYIMMKPNGSTSVTFGDLKNILRDLYYENVFNISNTISMLELIPYTGAVNSINRIYELTEDIVEGSLLPFYQGAKVDALEYNITGNTVTFTFTPQEESTLEFYAIKINS